MWRDVGARPTQKIMTLALQDIMYNGDNNQLSMHGTGRNYYRCKTTHLETIHHPAHLAQ